MPRRELFDSTRSAIAGKHDVSSRRPPDLWDAAPPGFPELLQSGESSLRQQGITQAAADEWSLRLTRGDIPCVDAQNNRMKFESAEAFYEYAKGFMPGQKPVKKGK